MKGIASMKEAYFKSLLKRVASTAWDSRAGSKHYFCPLVDEEIALQSSGCFTWMNWFAQKDVTGMISVDTDSSAAECAHSFLSRWCTDLNRLCILYRTWEVWGTVSFTGHEKFGGLALGSGGFRPWVADPGTSPGWRGQEAVATWLLCSSLHVLTSGQSSHPARTYTLKTIFQFPALRCPF